jgi:aspartyl protease family protein
MLRKLLLVGVFAGSTASIPVIYQTNPEAFHGFYESVFVKQETVKKQPAMKRMAAAKTDQESLPGRKVRLSADARGHFTGDFKLNGRRVEALVDTGATLVAINASMAKRIGIDLTPADFKYEVDTANGKARAASAMIDNLQIGRIYIESVQALVLDDKALDGTLIGMSFLKRLDKFEVADGALVLTQ